MPQISVLPSRPLAVNTSGARHPADRRLEISAVSRVLMRWGKELDDEFASITDDFDTNKFGSKTIPEGKYLVLGDNRTNSMDSRMLGFIDKSDIKGIVDLRVFPFNRMGTIK